MTNQTEQGAALAAAKDALEVCVGFIEDAHILEAQWGWEPVQTAQAALAKIEALPIPTSEGCGSDALEPRRLRKFLQALQAGEMSVSRSIEILDAWVHGAYSDDMVPEPPPDSALITDDEFPMELLRRMRAAQSAPVPAGYALVPLEPTEEMLAAAHEGDRQYTLRTFGDVMTVMQGPYDHWCAMVAAHLKAATPGDSHAT